MGNVRNIRVLRLMCNGVNMESEKITKNIADILKHIPDDEKEAAAEMMILIAIEKELTCVTK